MSVVAKILEQRTFNVPGKLKITEYFFDGVPRDWSNPNSTPLKLFARSVRKSEKPADSSEADTKKQLPWMVFLRGGPGFECASPQNWPATQSILDRGYQVLFLDQRGTGLSSPLSASTLGLRGDDPVQAEYLKSFRADSIINDCEAIRKCLTADYPESKRQWSLLGQSFGGFCCVTYLSKFPHGVKEAFICGGLPPLVNQPDPVYESAYKKVIERNEAYYAKYPEDVQRVKLIVHFLRRFGDKAVRLPSGGVLSARKFLQLGLMLGFHGGIDALHEIVLRASNELSLFGHLTRQLMNKIEQALPFDNNIIFALLHEPIYSQGSDSAPRWSAHRVREKYAEFDLDTEGTIFFTGEMIYPWMFEDYAELSKLKGPANIIAETTEWSELYDEKQLAKNEVPVYAAVYQEDMYVNYNHSMATAKKIKGCKVFTTNQMYHDAVRSKMDEVIKSLFALRDDTID